MIVAIARSALVSRVSDSVLWAQRLSASLLVCLVHIHRWEILSSTPPHSFIYFYLGSFLRECRVNMLGRTIVIPFGIELAIYCRICFILIHIHTHTYIYILSRVISVSHCVRGYNPSSCPRNISIIKMKNKISACK